MSDKDRLIADFQACTGIEDFAIALKFLEDNQWNLINAVNSAMGDSPLNHVLPDTFCESISFQSSQADIPFHSLLPPIPPSGQRSFIREHSSSSQFGPKTIKFNITYNDISATIEILESQTVGKLKEYLEEQFHVPLDDMYLIGWYNDVKVFNYTVLSSLCLPPVNNLTLMSMPALASKPKGKTNAPLPAGQSIAYDSASTPSSSHSLGNNGNYSLNIKNSSTNETFALNVPGTKSFSDIKTMVADLSGVPEVRQKWLNFPKSFSDASLPLSESGLEHKTSLEFSVKPQSDFVKNGFTNRPTFSGASDKKKSGLIETIDITSMPSTDDDEDVAIDEFHDTSSDLAFLTEEQDMEHHEFSSGSSGKRPQPLVEPNTTDIVQGQEHFVREFASRYGKQHPDFYVGTLGDALNASCNLPIQARKLLAIYLHNDRSILSNIFCSINLCYETIVSYLNANYILWAWDVTDPQNKARFLEIASAKFGKILETTIKNMQANEYPCLIILQKIRGQYEILNIFKGSTCLDDLMSILMQSVEVFRGNHQAFLNEELDRDRREFIKKEQDEAYRISLLADKAKKEARIKEFEQDQLMQRMKEEEDEYKMKEKEAIKKSLAESLPPEPPQNSSQEVTTIKIRVPWIADGPGGGNNVAAAKTHQRRFLADTPLQTLLDYVASLGYDPQEYAYMTFWPRADITKYDPSATLKSLNIYPQESLVLTERT